MTAADAPAAPGVIGDVPARRHLTTIDWYRAALCVAVVAWHTKVLGPGKVVGPAPPSAFTPSLADIAYFDVLLLAVPVFVAVSLLLYVRRRGEESTYWRHRLRHLATLWLFWVLAHWVVTAGFAKVPRRDIPAFLATGGHSIFYFFTVLVVLTVVVEVLLRIGARLPGRAFTGLLAVGLAGASALMLLRLPLARALPEGARPYVLAYWSVLNFLPYVFAVPLVLRAGRGVRTGAWLAVGAVAFVVLAALEWRIVPDAAFVPTDGTWIAPYGRPSILVGTLLLVAFALWRDLRVPAVVTTLSGLSLGIYCLHIFVLESVRRNPPAGQAAALLRPGWLFVTVLVASAGGAWMLRRGRMV